MAIPKPNHVPGIHADALPSPILDDHHALQHTNPVTIPRRMKTSTASNRPTSPSIPAPAESFAAETTKKSRDRFPVPTRQDWETMSLDDAHALVQKLIAAYQEGANIFNQRSSNAARESGMYRCMVCNKKKPQTVDNHPNYVWREDRPDPITRIYESKYICSSECYFRGANSGALTNAKVPGNVHK